jgi:hypothetical protein
MKKRNDQKTVKEETNTETTDLAAILHAHDLLFKGPSGVGDGVSHDDGWKGKVVVGCVCLEEGWVFALEMRHCET